jgi:hypothetical protein
MSESFARLHEIGLRLSNTIRLDIIGESENFARLHEIGLV